ncbi:hypothetical protein ACPWSR_08490 [Alloiococcus sp. CFN-8]|uniref:hypothetical protein n=1 Tax=Alloiococcus sp. CFN-8 TaxID=3416081 RepID=UPI003CFA3E5B
MNKKMINYFAVVTGIILLASGLILIKLIHTPQGIFTTLPYICVGIGCGIFGYGIGNIINSRIMYNNPDVKKQVEIELKDERNIAIQNSAKAKAYDMMIFVFGALMISLALMNVEMMVILMLVTSYLFVVGYSIYCRIKYNKEM